jgi:Leucine-rich repeat (LRR) protein
LGYNQLSGQIPASLGNLRNLRTLSMPDNDFNSVIPPELGGCTNLQTLYVFSLSLSWLLVLLTEL